MKCFVDIGDEVQKKAYFDLEIILEGSNYRFEKFDPVANAKATNFIKTPPVGIVWPRDTAGSEWGYVNPAFMIVTEATTFCKTFYPNFATYRQPEIALN